MTDQPPPVAVLRADREVIERAAVALRARAILEGYAGLPRQDVAFALALVLDELGRHVGRLGDELRHQIIEQCGGARYTGAS